jgi:CMP/dCMP kinase
MARIAFGGSLGAGKTEVCSRLAPALGYEYFYAGGIFKRMAAESGTPIEEFYASIGSQPEIDREVDRKQEELFRTCKNVVMEGRIAAFLAPEIPKLTVYLKVNPMIGARRQKNRPENRDRSVGDIVTRTAMRTRVERERYATLYPHIGDYLDERRFDIVIDTTNLSREDAYRCVLIELLKHPFSMGPREWLRVMRALLSAIKTPRQ